MKKRMKLHTKGALVVGATTLIASLVFIPKLGFRNVGSMIMEPSVYEQYLERDGAFQNIKVTMGYEYVTETGRIVASNDYSKNEEFDPVLFYAKPSTIMTGVGPADYSLLYYITNSTEPYYYYELEGNGKIASLSEYASDKSIFRYVSSPITLTRDNVMVFINSLAEQNDAKVYTLELKK